MFCSHVEPLEMYKNIRYLIILYATFIYFASIPSYLYLMDESNRPPAVWIALLWLSAIWIIVVSPAARRMLTTPLSIWCYGYFAIAAMSAAFVPKIAFETNAFSDAAVWAVSVVVLQLVFSGDERYQLFARKTILAGLILAIAVGAYDFLNPGQIVPFDHPLSNPGRAAGFYMNANVAGFALIVGTLLTVTLLPSRFRAALLAATSASVFVTFSRGALVVWLVMLVAFALQRIVSKRSLLTSHIVLVSVGFLFTATYAAIQIDQSSVNNLLGRLDWLSNPWMLQDDSGLERTEVLRLGWVYFLDSPAFGHGMGITRVWEDRSGTHNMYLELMVQFGTFGPLLLLWLFYGVAYKSTGISKQINFTLVLALALWGLFSHNLLTDYTIPLAFALVSAMGNALREPKNDSFVTQSGHLHAIPLSGK